MLTIYSRSEAETASIARALAGSLAGGDVVALIGDLGSGKTRFVEGACRALGYNGRVRSPTFTLLNIYQGNQVLHHFDLYRLSNGLTDQELDEWEEIFSGDGISFVEWAERLGKDLPPGAWVIHLYYESEQERRFEISGPAALLSAIQAAVESTISALPVPKEDREG